MFWLTKADAWIQTKLARYEKQPTCSGNILCEKRNWHKCPYRPVSINTYVKGIMTS